MPKICSTGRNFVTNWTDNTHAKWDPGKRRPGLVWDSVIEATQQINDVPRIPNIMSVRDDSIIEWWRSRFTTRAPGCSGDIAEFTFQWNGVYKIVIPRWHYENY